MAAVASIALVLGLLSGCGGGGQAAVGAATLDWSRTRPFGVGGAFDPPARGRRVAGGERIGSLSCGSPGGHPYGVHVELFAAGRIVRLPAGIGLAPPVALARGRVASARCAYPIRTVEPTGVVEVDPAAATATLGTLFSIWGQPLGPSQLAGFVAGRRQRVIAFVDGQPWRGDPRGITLRRHAQIVLEIGPLVSPHPSYRFASGL